MCGFVGVVEYETGKTDNDRFMRWALTDLKRRGPDQQVIWKSSDKRMQFGFARLAIQDLTDAGKQPMTSDDGRYVLMYNGETYNTEDLRQWAGVARESLKGHSDTEVILRCIAKKGVMETITRMDSIFAIALLDTHSNHLYLIRDHAGVKPLYAGINENGIVFSSHYHHITAHPYFRKESINETALTNYFKYGFIQAGEGLLHQTYFLPHAHVTAIDLETKNHSFNAYSYQKIYQNEEDLANLYKKVVTSQLVSDVPIGTFLSGGVDSTTTTALAAKAISNIKAYTIGVTDKQLDEADEAARFASYFEVDHQLKYISEQDIIEAIEQFDDSLAEPLADFSSLITLKVCEIAKRDLTVVLSGDGGDELFWGYPRFQQASIYFSYLKQSPLIRSIKIALARIRGKQIPFRLRYFNGFVDYYLAAQGLTGNIIWLSKVLKKPKKDVKASMNYEYREPKTHSEAMRLAKQIEFDIHLQRVLLKVDRASMYHSLEVRTPMLSQEFIRLSRKYEFEECNRNGVGKLPLRTLLQQLIPKGALNSGPKKGFTPPMAEWIRTSLKQKLEARIMDTPLVLKPYINEIGIKKIWHEHQSSLADHAWPIWAIYSLYTWMVLKMDSFEN